MEHLQLTDAKCLDEQRRAALLDHPSLNGIDYVEYEHRPAAMHPDVLVVRFVKALPDPPHSDPDGAYDLTTNFDWVRIEGGARVVGVRVLDVRLVGDHLEIDLDRAGDFSTYWLALGWVLQPDGRWDHVIAALDRRLSIAPVNFKAGCPTEFDCRSLVECPPEILAEPVLDYLAKDYSSFRRLLLDLIPQRNPGWLERNPADLGIALVELLAYTGDHLSYFQDAVATEAYLDTCRHRVSAKRHSRLIDYRMHDGRNAWSFVHFTVNDTGKLVPQGTMVLTRIAQALRGQTAPPGPVIPSSDLHFDSDPALRAITVFETAAPLTTDRRNNRLWLHTWGDRECCLPKGSTGAYLYGVDPGTPQVIRPPLSPGDYLLFEEVKGPMTALEADADPAHRQVVRIVSVEEAEDPVYQDQLSGDELQLVTAPGQTPLPLLRVTWAEADALTFPACISTRHPETGEILDVSIARGNVIPCDHGRTLEELLPAPVTRGGPSGITEVTLSRAPLTFQTMPPEPTYDRAGQLLESRHHLDASPREVAPAVVLILHFPPAETEIWTPVPHLLDSHPFDRHFAADVDNGGVTTIRFGDDEYGRRPVGLDSITARYRSGNGRAGNIGRESLVHVASPVVLTDWPDLIAIRQPIAARGGVDPESIEEVRQLAPQAFRAEQFRAVTEKDYERAALKLPWVAAAKCAFRWTGSWHTVFVAVHPRRMEDLITEEGGRTRLTDGMARVVRSHLIRYKLAGYDLETRTAQYVPLEISTELCVAPGHFRGDVLQAAYRALSNRQFADGTVGFFHLSRFTFGQPVYLSQLYAALVRVEGVDSTVVTVFKRYWMMANDELEHGVIPMGPWEIPRLDNDPNFMENGVLRLTAVGGL